MHVQSLPRADTRMWVECKSSRIPKCARGLHEVFGAPHSPWHLLSHTCPISEAGEMPPASHQGLPELGLPGERWRTLPHSSLPGSTPTPPSETRGSPVLCLPPSPPGPPSQPRTGHLQRRTSTAPAACLRSTGLASSRSTLILVMVMILDQLPLTEQFTTRWAHSAFLDREPPPNPIPYLP